MSESANLSNLFQSAQDDGMITPVSAQLLNIQDIGAQIQAGLGVKVGDINSSSNVLVSMLIDDSGSIGFVKGNPEAVVKGYNEALYALKDSKQKDSILVHSRALSGQIYTPFCELVDLDDNLNVPELVLGVYDPSFGRTPLYAQAKVLLGTVIAKAQELADEGMSSRTVTLIVTDGADNSSGQVRANHIQSIITDMLRQERHIVCGMGISDGGMTDFHRVFVSMGIPPQWILTPANTSSDIRRAFGVFSQSAVTASQAANIGQVSQAGFGSQNTLGGFTS
jgi:hypothetical protein